MTDNNELQHYGVKGMKWGVRKERNKRNEDYSDQQVKRDRQIYGRRGSNRINRSLNDGNKISVARGEETARRNAALRTNRPARIVGKGAGMVTGGVGGYIGHLALSRVLVSPAAVKLTTSLLGNNLAYQATALAVNPYTRLLVAGGMANVGRLLGGDAAVALNMRARGYDPDRK